MSTRYLEMISLIERLHRHFLDVVKLELDHAEIRDINNVQALMLFNINDDKMTISEITARGCYLGANASYNLRKLVENGYLAQKRSLHDRRSTLVWLSEKGCVLRDRLSEMHRWHVSTLPQALIMESHLECPVLTL